MKAGPERLYEKEDGYQILLGAGSGWPLDRLSNRHTGTSELTYITIRVTVRWTSEKRDR